MSVSLAGPCTVFDSFSPPSSSQPCTCTRWGGSRPGGQQHRRPVHAVEPDDLLADQVVHVRPPRVEALVVGAEADGGGVVDERVVPDVEDVALGPRHRHAPGRATCG